MDVLRKFSPHKSGLKVKNAGADLRFFLWLLQLSPTIIYGTRFNGSSNDKQIAHNSSSSSAPPCTVDDSKISFLLHHLISESKVNNASR